MSEEKIKQLQVHEQNLQNILLQKQQFQSQLIEIDTAIEELSKTDESYKIVGNIMIKSDKESLGNDLKQKKKIVEIRIKALEKQESTIKEKSKKVQEEVLAKK